MSKSGLVQKSVGKNVANGGIKVANGKMGCKKPQKCRLSLRKRDVRVDEGFVGNLILDISECDRNFSLA